MKTQSLDTKNTPTIRIIVQEVDQTEVDLSIIINKENPTIRNGGREINQETQVNQGTGMGICFDVIILTRLNT